MLAAACTLHSFARLPFTRGSHLEESGPRALGLPGPKSAGHWMERELQISVV